MTKVSPFLARVLAHAVAQPDAVAVKLVSARRGNATLTWRQLHDAAGKAAQGLAARGVGAGDRVVLIGTHHVELYACWLGAVWLGAIPTILAEPTVRVRKQTYWERLDALLGRIDARVVAHDARVTLRDPGSGVTSTRPVVTTADIVAGMPGAVVPEPVRVDLDSPLLLQHSSGTTGLHKGVVLSHRAVLSHAEAYATTLEMTSSDVVATWLPLYHDMGLIAAFVGPLLSGARVVWLSPFEWVANPTSLLEAIGAERATLAWLPNFAFAFLASRAPPTATYALGSLRHVVNCSEPVTARAVDAFVTRFAKDGLRRAAVGACYAMAENVFAMTSTHAHAPQRTHAVARGRWQQEQVAVDAADGDDAVIHLSCGVPVPGCAIKIAAPADAGAAPLGADRVGRILVRSPFLFSGYWRRDDLNGALFDADGYFDTGDLGYLDVGGHLYVTGRAKDILILAGKNITPQDLEEAVHGVAGIRAGRVVAFALPVAATGTDGLVVLAERDAGSDVSRVGEGPAAAIRAVLASSCDVTAEDVRVVPPDQLIKSTSGKLARAANAAAYMRGEFGAPAGPFAGTR